MIKTTLAPGAPWPYTQATEQPKPKPKRKWIPKPSNSKRQQTDAKFEAWLKEKA